MASIPDRPAVVFNRSQHIIHSCLFALSVTPALLQSTNANRLEP